MVGCGARDKERGRDSVRMKRRPRARLARVYRTSETVHASAKEEERSNGEEREREREREREIWLARNVEKHIRE